MGSPITAFAIMKRLYEKHGHHIAYWYYLALAEAGSPWRLLQYAEWIHEKVNENDDFPFLLRAYALNRQSLPLDDLTEHVLECLEQASHHNHLNCALYEKSMLLLRCSKLKELEAILPDKKTYKQWPTQLKVRKMIVVQLIKRLYT